MIDIGDLCRQPMLWCHEGGPDSSVVLCSRARLARNLADTAFKRRLDVAAQEDLLKRLETTLGLIFTDHQLMHLTAASGSLREALVERHIISLELARSEDPSAVFIEGHQRSALMLNEEDHVRLQAFTPGCNLPGALAAVVALDQRSEQHVAWAFDDSLGYLTACPSNAGTALRLSALVHLPALAESGELKRAARGLGQLHLAVRGLFGESSTGIGHFYQVSNQRTLGQSEDAICTRVEEAVQALVGYEQEARKALLEHRRIRLEDRIQRALATLTHARLLTESETIELLSTLRLGIALELVDTPLAAVDRLLVRAQNGHLRIDDPRAVDQDYRHALRADLVRSTLDL